MLKNIYLFQISDIRDVLGVRCTPKIKTVNVGLIMKFDANDDNEGYTQVKSNNGGGVKQLHLEAGKMYSVEDVIKMSFGLFTSTKAKRYLKYSTHKLGFSTDMKIEKFCDEKGHLISLIEYFTLHDLWKARKNLYLLCTATEEFWGEAAVSKNKDFNSTKE